jgi:uncharacterized protein YozE (UPF0346 family)
MRPFSLCDNDKTSSPQFSMRYCNPEQILKAIPDVRTIRIPDDWFKHLNKDQSIFNTLYKWMVEKHLVPVRDFNVLHNLTFASQKIHNRLLAAEKLRIAKKYHLKGMALEKQVNYNDVNLGPQTLFAKRPISGDVLIVFSSSGEAKIHVIESLFSEKERDRQNMRIRKLAAGSCFSEWLFSNCERDDPVGDLAKDALGDKNFPRTAEHHENVRKYLEFRGHEALEALNDAWLEYSMRYSDRIIRLAWCDCCGEQIINSQKSLIVWTEEEGFRIVHDNCLKRGDAGKYENLNELFMKTSNFTNFDRFAKNCMANSEHVEKIKNRLVIWGWVEMARAQVSKIYFIQSGTSGPIKIGYTASSVERRLSNLQTGHPEKLILLVSIEGNRSLEKQLHNQFNNHHLIGEWFHPHSIILSFIDEIKKKEMGTFPKV